MPAQKTSSEPSGCKGCLIVAALLFGFAAWYGWAQYRQIRLAMDLANGNVQIAWQDAAAVYFDDGSRDARDIHERITKLSKAIDGDEQAAFRCAMSTCMFLEQAGVQFLAPEVLQEMVEHSARVTAPIPSDRFMRSFVESRYPEAHRLMVEKMRNQLRM